MLGAYGYVVCSAKPSHFTGGISSCIFNNASQFPLLYLTPNVTTSKFYKLCNHASIDAMIDMLGAYRYVVVASSVISLVEFHVTLFFNNANQLIISFRKPDPVFS